MITRRAACSCGQLTATCHGDPVRISVCHCLACQQRTGSAFAVQARFPRDSVQIEGVAQEFTRVGDEGWHARFRFCPLCGATIAYAFDEAPDTVAVPVGAFADPTFPEPRVTVYEDRCHPWVRIETRAELERGR